MKRVILVMVIAIATTSAVFTQNNKNQTATDEKSIQDKFLKILVNEKKPGGIVWETNCVNRSSTEVKSEQPVTRAAETLDELVRADARYRWTSNHGAINLLPRTGEPEFLNIHIDELHIKDAKNVTLALDQILALPKVKEQANLLRLNQGIQMGGLSSPKSKESPSELHLKNVNLREALNLLASVHGYAIWKYSQAQCNGTNMSSLKFIFR